MAVPANVVCAWPGTAASIPAGWSRVTELDSRFVQGAATGADPDLTTDRGNLSHTHTSAAHTPIQDSHTHGITAANFVGDKVAAGAGSSVGLHSHTAVSNPATATNNSSTVNFHANTSNDPPFLAVIWIKSDGTPAGFPSTALAFFESDSLPANWSRVAADTYLKGASTGADGGATGGAPTHTHDSDTHTHTQNSHNHGTVTSAAGSTDNLPNSEPIDVASPTHTHQVTLAVGTGTNQALFNTTSPVDQEPLFKKLNTISNSGVDDIPGSVIAVFIGLNSAIPTNWTRYTALDGFFPKGANAGEALLTGGSQTHTHTATCQPIQDVHTHTASGSGPTGTGTGDEIITGSVTRQSNTSHTHTWTAGGAVPNNQVLTYNVDACTSEAAYPKYRRVIFIQFNSTPPPPPVRLGGYTSYDVGRFDVGAPQPALLPEVEAAMRHGDQRFIRWVQEGGHPKA